MLVPKFTKRGATVLADHHAGCLVKSTAFLVTIVTVDMPVLHLGLSSHVVGMIVIEDEACSDTWSQPSVSMQRAA